MLDRGAADLESILQGMLALRQRIDDHIDIAVLDLLDDIGAALVDLADNLDIDAHRHDGFCRSFGGCNLEIQLREGLGQLHHLFFILVGNREEHTALGRHIDAGADDCLVKGAGIVIIDAHDFACGLHLRSEGNVDVRHLRKGEYRSLDRYIRFWRYQTRTVAELLERRPQRDLRCQVDHLDIRYLGQERNRAA